MRDRSPGKREVIVREGAEATRFRSKVNRPDLFDSDDRVPLAVLDVTGLAQGEVPKPRQHIHIDSPGMELHEVSGLEVYTLPAGFHGSRGTFGQDDFLEIRADSGVIFLAPPPGEKTEQAPPGSAAGLGAKRPDKSTRRRSDSARNAPTVIIPLGEIQAEAIYLEGDIVLAQGPSVIRASRLYYDLFHERALILDAVSARRFRNSTSPSTFGPRRSGSSPRGSFPPSTPS